MARVNIQSNKEKKASVPASTSVVVLAEQNRERRFISIFNNSATAMLYVDIDNDPSLEDAMFALTPMETYLSEEFNTDGEVRGIWDVADGQANIREFME